MNRSTKWVLIIVMLAFAPLACSGLEWIVNDHAGSPRLWIQMAVALLSVFSPTVVLAPFSVLYARDKGLTATISTGLLILGVVDAKLGARLLGPEQGTFAFAAVIVPVFAVLNLAPLLGLYWLSRSMLVQAPR